MGSTKPSAASTTATPKAKKMSGKVKRAYAIAKQSPKNISPDISQILFKFLDDLIGSHDFPGNIMQALKTARSTPSKIDPRTADDGQSY